MKILLPADCKQVSFKPDKLLKLLELTTVVLHSHIQLRACIADTLTGILTFSWFFFQLVAQSHLQTTRAQCPGSLSGAQRLRPHPFTLHTKYLAANVELKHSSVLKEGSFWLIQTLMSQTFRYRTLNHHTPPRAERSDLVVLIVQLVKSHRYTANRKRCQLAFPSRSVLLTQGQGQEWVLLQCQLLLWLKLTLRFTFAGSHAQKHNTDTLNR